MEPTPTNRATPIVEKCPVRSPWLRRLGAAAFLFFLIKGLLWLIVPGVLAYLAMQK